MRQGQDGMSKKPARRAKSKPQSERPKAFEATLSGDKTTVTLAIEGIPRLRLNSVALEELQNCLGKVRAGMVPPVSAVLPGGASLSAVSNPQWVLSPAGNSADSLLNVRDPRYGWLHFVIPAEEGRKLSAFFTNLFVLKSPDKA